MCPHRLLNDVTLTPSPPIPFMNAQPLFRPLLSTMSLMGHFLSGDLLICFCCFFFFCLPPESILFNLYNSRLSRSVNLLFFFFEPTDNLALLQFRLGWEITPLPPVWPL